MWIFTLQKGTQPFIEHSFQFGYTCTQCIYSVRRAYVYPTVYHSIQGQALSIVGTVHIGKFCTLYTHMYCTCIPPFTTPYKVKRYQSQVPYIFLYSVQACYTYIRTVRISHRLPAPYKVKRYINRRYCAYVCTLYKHAVHTFVLFVYSTVYQLHTRSSIVGTVWIYWQVLFFVQARHTYVLGRMSAC